MPRKSGTGILHRDGGKDDKGGSSTDMFFLLDGIWYSIVHTGSVRIDLASLLYILLYFFQFGNMVRVFLRCVDLKI